MLVEHKLFACIASPQGPLPLWDLIFPTGSGSHLFFAVVPLRPGGRYEGEKIEDNADREEQSAYSEKHEKCDGIVPAQRKHLDQQAQGYERT